MATVIIKKQRGPLGREYVTAFDANTGQEISDVSAIDIRVRPDELVTAFIQVNPEIEPMQADGQLICEHDGKRYRLEPIKEDRNGPG